MTRLTPEVCFPETEGWPKSYFCSPYPLSENHYLVAWSDQEMIGWPGEPEPVNATGIYLFDAFGNLNLVYRDPAISSECPLPIRPRPRPKTVSSLVQWDGPQEGRMLLANVYDGLPTVPRGTIERLRIVGIPPKTHPTMNQPVMGLMRDDPGKFVMGTVPVEPDGSAHFRVPSGVTMFFQALDAQGVAVQTMRSATYVQPGQTHACIGCHEPRHTAPPPGRPLAFHRQPSPITLGPQGSWPWDYTALVQPVLDKHCVACHQPETSGARFDLTAAKSYDTLADYGKPSLRELVRKGYIEGRSTANAGIAQRSPLLQLLAKEHYEVTLDPDARQRLTLWLDLYGQRLGSFSQQQTEQLRALCRQMAPMLSAP